MGTVELGSDTRGGGGDEALLEARFGAGSGDIPAELDETGASGLDCRPGPACGVADDGTAGGGQVPKAGGRPESGDDESDARSASSASAAVAGTVGIGDTPAVGDTPGAGETPGSG